MKSVLAAILLLCTLGACSDDMRAGTCPPGERMIWVELPGQAGKVPRCVVGRP